MVLWRAKRLRPTRIRDLHMAVSKTPFVLLMLVLSLSVVSCDFSINRPSSPKDYQTEIEDYVKFEIAVGNVMIKQYNGVFNGNAFVSLTSNDFGELYSYAWDEYCERIDEFEEAMGELWCNEECPEGYLSVLQKVTSTSGTYQYLAEKVLGEYKNMSVILSEYSQLATSSDTKVWRFQELNTGIYFRFYLNDIWSCEPEESSIIRYFNTNT